MPTNEKLSALEALIQQLRWNAVTIQGKIGSNETISSKSLLDAAEGTKQLFALLQPLMSEHPPEVPGLDKYLAEVIKISAELADIAEHEKAKIAKPNLYMQRLIVAFEAFSTRVASEHTRQRLRRAASFIPVIDGVVAACGGIPYYFEHANTQEKIAMILCATLLVTALALTIAVYASPAVAAVPLLWPAITACVLLARVLYDQASFNAKKKYEEKTGILTAVDNINELNANMQEHEQKVDAGRRNMETAATRLDKFIHDTAHDANFTRKLYKETSASLATPGARRRKKNADLYRIPKSTSKIDNDKGRS